jgi:transcriptional regulator of acetoin/glycerol metabolism
LAVSRRRWWKTLASQVLGLDRETLYRKLERYDGKGMLHG